MKTIIHPIIVVAALLLAGCDRTVTEPRSLIRFSASSSAGSTGTRAVYSGVVTSGTERIDWEVGDLLRIGCVPGDGSGASVADYVVTGGIEPDGFRSRAAVAIAEGDGLFWKNCRHDFAALCPSPETDAPGSGKMSSLGYAVSGTTVSASIPKQQAMNWINSYGQPDMRHAPLMASVKAAAPPETVRLAFRPAFNAFQFTFRYEKQNTIQVFGFELKSSTSALSGAYTVDFTSGTDGAPIPNAATITPPVMVSSGTGANNIITANLNMVMTENDEFTITVFTVPGNHCEIEATLFTDCGNKTLSLKDDHDEYITFPSCGKARIAGLVIPNSPRISFVAILLEPWNTDSYELIMNRDALTSFRTSLLEPWNAGGNDFIFVRK